METVELLSHLLFRAKTRFLVLAAFFCVSAEADPGRCEASSVENLSYFLQQAFLISSRPRNHAAGVNPSGKLIFPFDNPAHVGDVDPVYLWEGKEAVAEILFDGHFEINRPLGGEELKMKKRTRGRPKKVIASCTSKNKTHKPTKN